ncbi:MAG: trypsin-like peptidase domain-containing protein [Pseudomonadales bacterium]|nr:trypsin-like peptidase domain-containing protein [Pseudomonadales bacterium]
MRKTYHLPIILGLCFGIIMAIFVTVDRQPQLPSWSFAEAASRAAPSVVNIYTTKAVNVFEDNQNSNPQRYNQRQRRLQQKRELSLGSGVILHKNGFIITNMHVIENAEEILVLLYDGRSTLATVVGTDKATDLAVLKIDLSNLKPVKIGNSDKKRVGDAVLAIGNPYGFGQSVSAGIISAKGRYGLNMNTYENFIQTDAAINIGSSGGALVDDQGELIGVNSAIYSQQQGGGSVGIGLAIPIEIATKVMKDIISHGYVIRGWLGLDVTQLNPVTAAQLGISHSSGIVITRVQRGGPAQSAGLRAGDVIVSIHDQQVTNGQDGLLKVANLEPGQTIRMEVLRDNQALLFTPILGIRPIK